MAKPVRVVVLGDSKDAQKAFKEIRSEAEKTEGPLSSFGEKLGGFATAAAGVALGVGTAVAGLFAKGFLDGMEAEQLNDKLAAQLGLSEEDADKAGRIASDVYRNAWGDSLGEVNEAIRGIEQALGGLSGVSEDEAQAMVEDALTIADVWDQDVNEVIRAAGSLLDSELAQSADEAFDIIATGLQEGVDLNGDFLDTLFEYSTFFADAGISAEDMLAGLIAGTEAGMMGVDKVGDAVKEMGLKIQEQSPDVQQALEDIGLDAESIADAFAKGGDFAAEASDMVLEALASMEDPLEQQRAAVALLGTPYEDLGVVGPEVLQALVDGTVDVIDTTDIANTAYDNLATSIEEFKRKGLGAVQDFVGGVLAGFGATGGSPKNFKGSGTLKSGIDALSQWLDDNRDQIKEWGREFGEKARQFWEDLQPTLETLGDIKDEIGDIIDSLPGWAKDFENWAKVAEAAVAPLFNVISEINKLLGRTNDEIDDIEHSGFGGGGGFGSGSGGGADLPVLHNGGPVPGPFGADVPAILQAGEFVIPAGGSVPMVNNFYIDGSVVAERDLIDLVHDGLLRKQRRTSLGFSS